MQFMSSFLSLQNTCVKLDVRISRIQKLAGHCISPASLLILNEFFKKRSKNTLPIKKVKTCISTTNFYYFILSISFLVLKYIYKKYIVN
jgi:hypothetical protein